MVSSWFTHFGEEESLRGRHGSGTIFFSNCNLKCVFCQNHDISQRSAGKEVTPEQLADIILFLQAQDCHNINFVTPEHVVPQILEALPTAIRKGLRLPLVYNTGSYDSLDSIRLMNGIIDIYMPDFKFWHSDKAGRYLKASDYPEVARQVITEMHRQVVLRAVRDTYMLNNAFGTALVDGYYRVSPALADVVAQHPALAAGIRVALIPVIYIGKLVLALPHVSAALAGLSLFMVALRRKKGKADRA